MVLQPIYLPHLLKQPRSTQVFQVDQAIADLATLTPVRGAVTVRHGGTFLEVTAQAETIVTLHCDRCAQGYNQKLELDTQEILWLDRQGENPALASERELSWDDLSEVLPPDGHFDLETWLYEQFNLALPLKNLCGKDCQAPEVPNNGADNGFDHRWAALADLKRQLN
ncbi:MULTISPECIES: DUF177 domain-containing protein [unclassified Synechocystis]|uniref:YceD family protein n=1 Tax=unclassified Synechocystis TaxID=2640012 RepID=UPI00048B81C1|nr:MULTISPECIES: DUF177 domain-containing protein [unclassified Synechocystis]MCT0254712.1 DUF177 domain-containing protein [Synechocystis sp. CS-94]